MYVLVDTNILAYKTMVLRGGLGPSLLYLAKMHDAKIVVPDALRGELRQHAVLIVTRACRALERELHQVQLWTGRGRVSKIPDAATIERSVEDWLANLSQWLHPVPTSPDLIQRAAKRVFDKTPPSHTREGFKDSVIWESLLTLPAGAEVLFASDDAAAFFDESGEELHPTLKAEADSHELTIKAFRTLEELLKELQGEQPPFDSMRAQQLLTAMLIDRYAELTGKWGLEGFDIDDPQMTPFLTETPGILAIQFISKARCAGTVTINGQSYSGASVRIIGSCDYDPHGSITNLRIERESLVSSDDTELPAAIAYLHTASPRDTYKHREKLVDRAKQAATKPKGQQKKGPQKRPKGSQPT